MLTRIFRGCLFALLFCIFLFLGLYVWGYSSIPDRATFTSLRNNISSEVFSKDGKLIGKYFLQDRTNVPFEKISPNIINALIATEDVRFYQHHGVDKRGLMRVFFKTLLLRDESSGGGSTITQQLAKNLFPRKDYGYFSLPINKLREAIMAEKLEDVFSKKDIIAFYLNTVPFGENAFGIEVASKRFFSKHAAALKPEEAAVLVGMLKATTSFNPKRHPEASLGRRNVVLEQMAKYGYLTKEEKDSLQALPLVIDYRFLNHNHGLATYFRQNLRGDLLEWCAQHKKEDGSYYNLYTDGLKIYTTIDSRMQTYAEEAVEAHMKKLQALFFQHWGKSNPWGRNYKVVADAMKRSVLYRQLKSEGKSAKEIAKIFNTKAPMEVFSWKGNFHREMSPLDSIKYYLKFLHAGFVVMDPQTGEVKAWVGDIDHEFFQYDHVHRAARRQVGSTFKPIVYAEALEEGVSPCTYFPNDRKVYEAYDNWSPENADGKYGGSYSLYGALTNSVNTVSVQVMMRAGIKNVVELAKRMGITAPLDPVPSLALGTADISLIEMVNAYSTFSQEGYFTDSKCLLRIESSDGKVLADFSNKSKKSKVLSPHAAAVMVKMMENVVNVGTAARLRTQYEIPVAIAGKTGTTQSQADGWFIGYTPDLIAGAWVGGEDRRIHFRSLRLGQGASMALPIWAEFMQRLLADKHFSYMKNKQFANIPGLAEEMDCIPYIPADSTFSLWDRIFGTSSFEDSLKEVRRIEKINEREERKEQPRSKNHDVLDDFFNLFKRKRR